MGKCLVSFGPYKTLGIRNNSKVSPSAQTRSVWRHGFEASVCSLSKAPAKVQNLIRLLASIRVSHGTLILQN